MQVHCVGNLLSYCFHYYYRMCLKHLTLKGDDDTAKGGYWKNTNRALLKVIHIKRCHRDALLTFQF